MEETILGGLVYNDSYTRVVLPHLKTAYFEDAVNQALFQIIGQFITTFNNRPSIDTLKVEWGKVKSLKDNQYKAGLKLLLELKPIAEDNLEWALKETEKWCRTRAIVNAITKGITILENKDKDKDSIDSLPDLLSDALGVTFDSNVGHDYINDSDKRFEYYHRENEKLPFDIDLLNKITKGGIEKKTLNCVLAATNSGKTILLCHCASHWLTIGKNVLYLTMEMAEEKIAERIDANLLDISMDNIEEIPKDVFDKKINRLKAKGIGCLKIKEYPTGQPSALTFRNTVNELKMKQNFVPDVIIVDYLNICSSSRCSMKSVSANLYIYVKSIAEELRAMAKELGVPILTATQSDRSSMKGGELDIDNVSESKGLPDTCDLLIGMYGDEKLDECGQRIFKQLKNRYGDKAKNRKFAVGLDKTKMRFYDLEKVDKDILKHPEVEEFGKEFETNLKGLDEWNI